MVYFSVRSPGSSFPVGSPAVAVWLWVIFPSLIVAPMIHFLSGKIPLFPVCTVVILSSLIALPHTVPVLSLLESTFVCVASSSRSGIDWYWDTPPCACWSTSLRTYMLLARTWACWRNSTAFFLVS